MHSQNVEFSNAAGEPLSGVLEVPEGGGKRLGDFRSLLHLFEEELGS